MFSLRPNPGKLAAVAVGALGGATAGIFLGGSVGAGLGGFVAGAEGESFAYHVGMGALLFAYIGILLGAVVGALLGSRFWKRHGRRPQADELGLAVFGNWGGRLNRAVAGAVVGALCGVPVGLISEASVLGGALGKSYGGDAGGILGLIVAGCATAALVMAGLGVLGRKARWQLIAPRAISRPGAKAPGPLARAARGGLKGTVMGALIASMFVLPALATEPMRFLELGTATATGMAWACALVGFALGALRDVLVALTPPPSRSRPARSAGLPPGQSPLPS